jgi:cytochrome bd ubiquinol oxidase subunit II
VAFGSVMSTLYIPLFGAMVGIVLRGAAFALRGQAATIGEARLLGAVFAFSSVITPFFMGAALGGVASGDVPVGNAAGDPWTSWTSPTSLLVGVLAVATGAYLSAVFLAGDSERAEQPDLVAAFRVRALGAAVVAGALAAAGLAVLNSDAPDLFDGLTSGAGLACVIVSGVAGVTTLALVWVGRYFVARFSAALAVAGVTAGWAFAQSPYLLPGELTLDQAAAPDATLTAMLVSVALGLVVLVPSLWLLYSLVLRGRLDQTYEPLDQQFRP